MNVLATPFLFRAIVHQRKVLASQKTSLKAWPRLSPEDQNSFREAAMAGHCAGTLRCSAVAQLIERIREVERI